MGATEIPLQLQRNFVMLSVMMTVPDRGKPHPVQDNI